MQTEYTPELYLNNKKYDTIKKNFKTEVLIC